MQKFPFKFLLGSLLFLAFSQSQAQTGNFYFPPKVGNTWQTLTPESQGFCPERVTELYQFLETENTKGFILLKDGKIVLEKYFGTFVQDSFWYWASAGKSLTAFMVGQAQEQGLLSISDTTSKFLGLGWTACPPEKERLITIRHQLNMTSGMLDNDVPTPANPDPSSCTDPTCLTYIADAGTRWAYHNAPYRLLHNVLAAASNQTINQYTKQQVLDPTGMKGFWYDDVFFSRTRDMARFGLLTLANGIWNGDTLLHDADFLHDMAHPSQMLNRSYGYLWWLNGQSSFMLPTIQFVFAGKLIANAPDDMFAALGKNDQKIHIVPSKGWVVVRMGNSAGNVGPSGGQVPIVFDNDLWAKLNALTCDPTSTNALVQSGPAITIAPNPASDAWVLSATLPIEHITLYDQQGKVLLQKWVGGKNECSVMNASLEHGIYFLEIRAVGEVWHRKVVKGN